jgi:carbon-monoxide dehydrogenase medium subunit
VKPPPFAYVAPGTLDEALSVLAQYGADAKLLAGGQSLMPLLAMRLARPSVVVDLNRIEGLAAVDEAAGEEGRPALSLGALVRHRTLERDPTVRRLSPLLAEAAAQVGHPAIRVRGTVGGSLVHSDPAAEYPAVACAQDATFVLASPSGRRQVAASDFFLTYLTTDVAPDEILVEVRLAALPEAAGTAFVEMARRHGDFALVAVACALVPAEDGTIATARLALSGVGGTPYRASEAEALLEGRPPDETAFAAAAEQVRQGVEPEGDLHASADFRRHLAGVYTVRALRLAAERAKGDGAWRRSA